ncbi:endonuclease/exonuclease/phosphatase family protein [Rhabdothermincola sp.]|uniref:endonuclease/exonuclease/phosphatase family protein n=1 Tax=Rhabdothermincola sp. TaxID=2820405 RepID=UPI002FE40623
MRTTPAVPRLPVGRVAVITATWVVAVGSAAVVLSSMLGFTWGTTHAALQMVLPYYVLPSSASLGVAVWFGRRRLAVVAGLTTVAVCSMMLPLVTGSSAAVRAGEPTLDVYVANLRFDNPTPERAVDQALASGADVLVLIELTPAHVELFHRRGADQRYPFQELDAARDTYGTGIFSRLPLRDARVEKVGGIDMPTGVVRVGDQDVEIWGVHVGAPTGEGQVQRWEWRLGQLRRFATRLNGPTVIAGDFNAGRWHPAFRWLLDRGDLRDAHEAVGRGLSPSWPMEGRGLRALGPFTRLDHALLYEIDAVEVRDLPAAGSDHRPFVVTLAVGTDP